MLNFALYGTRPFPSSRTSLPPSSESAAASPCTPAAADPPSLPAECLGTPLRTVLSGGCDRHTNLRAELISSATGPAAHTSHHASERRPGAQAEKRERERESRLACLAPAASWGTSKWPPILAGTNWSPADVPRAWPCHPCSGHNLANTFPRLWEVGPAEIW